MKAASAGNVRNRRLKVFLLIGLCLLALVLWIRGIRHLAGQGEEDVYAARAAEGFDPSRPNGFDVSNAVVPREEIVSGGPPRDGIPAIDRPQFLSPEQVRYLEEDDAVISVTVGGETRAYPLRILVWHEIVNDRIGDRDVAVTYCPLCGTAMVFNRSIQGASLNFGVSGLLYQSDVLMYDRETESLWSQLARKCVAGKLVNTQLEWIASDHMTWAAWKGRFPAGRVLSTETGHRRDYRRMPYEGYEQTPRTLFPVPAHRMDLENKAWVVGTIVDGVARAYPVDEISGVRVVTEVSGNSTLEISYDPETRHAVVRDLQRQQVIPSVLVYWFAWQAFYPETTLWRR